MSLEPGKVLDVEPPGLLLKFLRRQILLVGPGEVVEDVEQGFNIELREDRRVREGGMGLLGIISSCGVGVARHVVSGPGNGMSR